ncbi:hypothetical protein K0A97_00575 [Patescibacteria group bacterium]|nr:hypothetical protein [Patescibacteria group bacterium]
MKTKKVEKPKKELSKGRKYIKKVFSLRERAIVAWRSLNFFLILFIVSFVLHSLSLNELLENFFGILWIIFAFLTLAFLIAFIVLVILRTDSKKNKENL